MVNADRCMQLLDVPEEQQIGTTAIRPQWPEEGLVEFKGVSLRYRPNTDVVLHRLSFRVEAGQKIGVVGRTGAGKSTICLCLSRIIEIFEGNIQIDGVDI